MKNIKRITKILGLCCAAAAGLLLVVLVASQLTVVVRMERFSQQLFDCPLPAQTVVLERYTVHDRLHTGNNERLEYTALMLVESQLPLSELTAYYTAALSTARGPSHFGDAFSSYQEDYRVELDVSAALSPLYQPAYNQTAPFTFEYTSLLTKFEGLYYLSIHY